MRTGGVTSIKLFNLSLATGSYENRTGGVTSMKISLFRAIEFILVTIYVNSTSRLYAPSI